MSEHPEFECALLRVVRPELIVEQRCRDEVFEVVIALLSHLRIVLCTEGSATCEFEGPLEDIAAHAFNVGLG